MAPVKVDLNVSVDASGNVEVFGQAASAPRNIVVCDVNLPVTNLYNDASGTGLIKFWEPSSAPGDISGTRVNYPAAASFSANLATIIAGDMDASGATPFNALAYASTPAYYNHENFGRLALSAYAHYLFGHVAATAAITNDEAFIANMNGSGANDAQLANKLAGALTTKDDAAITEIVKQVIGQDAERAKDQDNNQLAPDVQQVLKFYPGDIIYMNINLKTPIVSVFNSLDVAQQSEPLASAFAADQTNTSVGEVVGEISYTLQITLA